MHPCGRVAFARVFSSHSIRVAAPRRYHRSTVNKTVSMAPMHYSPVLSGLRASVYIRRNFVSNIQSESEIRPASFPRKGGNFPGIDLHAPPPSPSLLAPRFIKIEGSPSLPSRKSAETYPSDVSLFTTSVFFSFLPILGPTPCNPFAQFHQVGR